MFTPRNLWSSKLLPDKMKPRKENKMSIHRTEKRENSTIVSNDFLRRKDLSLKAKGLLTFILSLPDEWKFTVEGLATQLKECKSSVSKTLVELESKGYITRSYPRNDDGKIVSAVYEIYESPPEEISSA